MSRLEIPGPGQMVLVRRRPAVVRDVVAYGNGNPAGVLHLADVEYVDGWAHPDREQVLWEREVGARVLSSLSLPGIDAPGSRPDAPDLFDAFVDAIRWSSVTTAPLVSPWQSAIQVEDYQLYPVLKALLMPRVSLLLADDVGLGKTIEAGLILTELIARRRLRRVLVVCPAALQTQWRDELAEKFHLDCTVMDRATMFRIQRELGMDANPLTVSPRIITSMDFLRQPDVRESFLGAARRFRHPEEPGLPWDVLVVDEAHNLMPSSFGDDSQRTAMLREIAPLFEHRLFLTATPHNGYTLAFTGLLELLDPVRFSQDTELSDRARTQLQTVMVRRLKSELNEGRDPTPFPERAVKRIEIALRPEERTLFDALRAYREEGLALVQGRPRRERTLGRFVFALLTKRLLSGSYAFARTWWEHVEGFALPEGSVDLADLARRRAEESLNDDAEKGEREADALRQGAAWLRLLGEPLFSRKDAVTRALEAVGWTLDRMTDPFPPTGLLPPDAKWDALQAWIKTHLMRGTTLRPDERLLLFTEYKDTLAYLMWRLGRAGLRRPAWQELYGGGELADRDRVKEAFNDPGSPLRILLATDTASEGLNLQTACRYVIHQEIPWNPMRLEQRNGRVDRHNQPRDVVAWHFHSDEDADLQFLSRVAEKVNQVREDLGSVGQVIDQAVLEHFAVQRVTPDALDQRVSEAAAASPERNDLAGRDRGRDEAYREALATLHETEASLGLAPEALVRLLGQAASLEGGRLVETAAPRFYRLNPVPPAWETLVAESLRLERGDARGALPKLTFSAEAFEVLIGVRRIFRPLPDAVLLRLGHPVMRRALGVLKRRMWDDGRPGGLTRWTVRRVALPAGADRALILYALLQVTNQLREVHHAELLPLGFRAEAGVLVPLEPSETQAIVRSSRTPLSSEAVARLAGRIQLDWPEHREVLRRVVAARRAELEATFRARLAAQLEEGTTAERAKFQERRKELASQRQPRALERLRREAETAERALTLSPYLFAEMQEPEERRLRDLHWELHRTQVDQLGELLDREETRLVDRLLPRRFALAQVDLQPVAVEYVVASEAAP